MRNWLHPWSIVSLRWQNKFLAFYGNELSTCNWWRRKTLNIARMFGFHKCRGISWLVKRLFASEEGLRLMKSVNWKRNIMSIFHCLMMALKISKRSVHLQIKDCISVNVRTFTELLCYETQSMVECSIKRTWTLGPHIGRNRLPSPPSKANSLFSTFLTVSQWPCG